MFLWRGGVAGVAALFNIRFVMKCLITAPEGGDVKNWFLSRESKVNGQMAALILKLMT